jgi:hypothetical protein
MADYYNKMKSHADDMASSGHPLGDEEFVTYILTGLDEELYHSLVSSIVTRVEPISPLELYSQMLSFELCLNKQSSDSYSTANTASRGCGTSWSHGGPQKSGRGRGHGRGGGRDPSPSVRGGYTNKNVHAPATSSDTGSSQPRCQVCMKVDHTTATYWYRYDVDYVPDNHMVAIVSSSHTDPNWYIDSGVTDHITSDLEQLTMHEKYNGHEHIRAANGAGMDIIHVGKTVLPASSPPPPPHTHTLHLNHVLSAIRSTM